MAEATPHGTFETELEDRPANPGTRLPRVLESPLRYRYEGEVIEVPAGFETDFASIPRWLWFLFPRGVGRRAAVIHDWLYRQAAMSRRRADRLFYHALRADGVVVLRAWLMWLAVRLFGWLHWGSGSGM